MNWQVKALLVAVLLLAGARASPAQVFSSERLSELLGGRFIENAGQWPQEVLLASTGGSMRVWVGSRGIALLIADPISRRAETVLLEIVSPPLLQVKREATCAGSYNFLRGSDSADWHRQVQACEAVTFESGDETVSLRARPAVSGVVLELMRSGDGSPGEVRFRVSGGSVVAGERASIRTPLGELRQRCDVCQPQTTCRSCGGGLGVEGDNLLRWSPSQASEEAGHAAVIGLEWSTFLAGENSDRITAAAFASDGSVIVGGNTFSMDFPTTPGSYDPEHAPPSPLFFNYDMIVARFSPDGSALIYSTFIGGDVNDFCYGLAVVDGDEPIILGNSASSDFPTTVGAFDTTYSFSGDATITRLTGDGSELVYSTYLGGSHGEQALTMVIAPDGCVLVGGETSSIDFPVTEGAYDEALYPASNQNDGFVTKLSADAKSLIFSTYLGASSNQDVSGIAVFPDGSLALTGRAGSANFPTTPGGLQDEVSSAFVARMSADGSTLLWSTFFGGTCSLNPRDVVVDAAGNLIVLGTVNPPLPPEGFPSTPGSFDPTYNGDSDVFVSKIDPTGTTLLWSTFLGGTGQDTGWDLILDPSGVVTVFGATRSGDFPVTAGAYDETQNGDWDFFVTRLAPDGDRLFYSTFLGGSWHEPYLSGKEMDAAVNLDGEVVIVGATRSTDYPLTPGAFQTEPDFVSTDGVVTRLNMLPAGVTGLGNSTPGCAGSLPIGVAAMPQVGSEVFGLWCSGAPLASGRGFLGVSLAPLSSPLIAVGVELWLDPLALSAVPVKSDALGYCELPLRVDDDAALVGVQVWAQFFWADACGPSGWASSRALGISVQP